MAVRAALVVESDLFVSRGVERPNAHRSNKRDGRSISLRGGLPDAIPDPSKKADRPRDENAEQRAVAACWDEQDGADESDGEADRAEGESITEHFCKH